jgi:hypothetical protein
MINELFFEIALYIFSAISLITAIYFYFTTKENVKDREKFCRRIKSGTFLTMIALLCCAPISEPVVPNFLIPYLFPLAIVFTFLAYKYIDYHMSRAIAGTSILIAGFFVANLWTFAYPENSFIGISFALLIYTLGIIGITISAKPYLLRDWFRKVANCKKAKYITIIYFMLFSVTSLLINFVLLK